MSGPPPPYNPPGQFYQNQQQPYNPQFQGPVQGQPGWGPQQPNTFYPGQPQPGFQQPYPGQPQSYPQGPYTQQPQTVVVHECHDNRRDGISDEQCCCIALLGACCLACCLAD